MSPSEASLSGDGARCRVRANRGAGRSNASSSMRAGSASWMRRAEVCHVLCFCMREETLEVVHGWSQASARVVELAFFNRRLLHLARIHIPTESHGHQPKAPNAHAHTVTNTSSRSQQRHVCSPHHPGIARVCSAAALHEHPCAPHTPVDDSMPPLSPPPSSTSAHNGAAPSSHRHRCERGRARASSPPPTWTRTRRPCRPCRARAQCPSPLHTAAVVPGSCRAVGRSAVVAATTRGPIRMPPAILLATLPRRRRRPSPRAQLEDDTLAVPRARRCRPEESACGMPKPKPLPNQPRRPPLLPGLDAPV